MENEKKNNEEKFLIDYYRFAIHINLYGVAPYLRILDDIDAASLSQADKASNDELLKMTAINTHRFLNESYENLAQFLQSLVNRKENDIPFYEYLADKDISRPKTVPRLSKIENADVFLEKHGLPVQEKEIEGALVPGGLDKMKETITNRLSKLFKLISKAQDIHSPLYNTTKHSKSWVSSAKKFMDDPNAPDAPMALIVENGSIQKRWVSISFSKAHILQDIYIIQGVAVAMRDLLLLFAFKYYPGAARTMLSFGEPLLIKDGFDKGVPEEKFYA